MQSLPESQLYTGIDLGGTKITAGLVDAAGRIRQKETVKTDKSPDPQKVIQQIADLARKLAAGQRLKIGIGIPGQVKNGRVVNTPNIPQLDGVELLQSLTGLYPAEYTFANDANAAALAELK
ncbi:MAG: ROK family protein, partial [Candidatus Margulisbacteria bacterium]|nr:ROK family protein [Candidatus Margulisiibacteriota bacterium]